MQDNQDDSVRKAQTFLLLATHGIDGGPQRILLLGLMVMLYILGLRLSVKQNGNFSLAKKTCCCFFLMSTCVFQANGVFCQGETDGSY